MRNDTCDARALLAQSEPLIVVGMHRSGTSLMVRLLADVGVHMGTWLSRDAESVHFQRLNRAMYRRAGSSWGDVEGILKAMRSEAFVAREAEWATRALTASRILRRGTLLSAFFGESKWSGWCRGDALPWGWKDPRTSLTLPIWARVFPRARWVHVLRSGVDVAKSLRARSQLQRRRPLKRLLRLDYCPATLDLGYGLWLWQVYVSRILGLMGAIPAQRQMLLRYEDLLGDPVREMRRVVEFGGYPVDEGLLAAACQRVDRGRNVAGSLGPEDTDHLRDSPARGLMQDLGYP